MIYDKAGAKEMAKLFDVTNPHDLTSGWKPVPVTCPKCGNYKNNTRNGMAIKVTKMPRRELYTCSACGELFNDPYQR